MSNLIKEDRRKIIKDDHINEGEKFVGKDLRLSELKEEKNLMGVILSLADDSELYVAVSPYQDLDTTFYTTSSIDISNKYVLIGEADELTVRDCQLNNIEMFDTQEDASKKLKEYYKKMSQEIQDGCTKDGDVNDTYLEDDTNVGGDITVQPNGDVIVTIEYEGNGGDNSTSKVKLDKETFFEMVNEMYDYKYDDIDDTNELLKALDNEPNFNDMENDFWKKVYEIDLDNAQKEFNDGADQTQTYPAKFTDDEIDYDNQIYYYGFTYALVDSEDDEPQLIVDYSDADVEFSYTDPVAIDCNNSKITYKIFNREVSEQEFIKLFVEAVKDSGHKFNFTETDVKNLIDNAIKDSKERFLGYATDNFEKYERDPY